ncbi:MAG TPA: hypothetical protein VK103_01125 [Bacillota bacterium]|nr:hypothetical protein [Bacillota bacterium]
MYTHDGGGGGSYYTLRTHRELNAYVASASTIDLDRLRRNWDDSGRNAHQMADLIEAKLAKLTAAGGWTGPGAEAFANTIRKELVANLRDYARRAGGYTPEGEQNVSHAHDLEVISEAVSGSYSAANSHNIPWDVDTTWNVRQKHVDQSLFSHIEEAVTGEDEDYEKAKKNAPYEIVNGGNSVVKEVPKPQYEPIESSVPPNPSSTVYEATNTSVAPTVKRFDLILERLGLGEGPKQHVYTAVNNVHSVLSSYAPEQVTEADTTDKGTSTGAGATNGPGAHGGGGGAGTSPGRNFGPPGGGGGGTGGGGGDHGGGTGGGYDGPDHDTNPGGPIGGPGTGGGDGGHDINPGGPIGGPGDGGGVEPPLTGGVGGGETGAAGAGPSAPPVGGIGAPAPAPAAAPVSVGAGPGVGGLGSLGPGAMNAGAPGTSFGIGADGRPTVNTGKVGAIAGGANTPDGAGVRGAGSGAGGAHGAGPHGAGMPASGARGRRTGSSGDDEQEQELDETWLEEDESVWGNRAAAPPSEIR